ncbi:MAG: DNA methyltransferase [Methanospirillum sp.]
MSRLTDLLRQAKALNPQMGADLEAEFRALSKRRSFGLVFERHRPEAVDLPHCPARRGDTVRILPPRGSTARGDRRLWKVTRIERSDGQADLVEVGAETPGECSVSTDDLVVVAAFRDPIYPGLVETGRIERGEGRPYHTVINGENFHALEMLTYTHRHAIDAIYIDPPYNTGAKDWKYNNDYVEGDDLYRHSKWLAMMERRLTVAKELLNPDDSVLIVTIDEKEVHRLGLLLEQLFPEAHIQMVTIVTHVRGVQRGTEMARVEEYAFFCFFGSCATAKVVDTMLEQNTDSKNKGKKALSRFDIWLGFVRGGNNSRRTDRPHCFFPIFVDPATRIITEVGEPIPLDADRRSVPDRPGLVTVWPLHRNGEEAVWQGSAEYCRWLLDQGMAKIGSYDAKSGYWSPMYLNKGKRKKIETRELKVTGRGSDGSLIVERGDAGITMTPKTVWNRPRHAAGEYGSRLVRMILSGRKFPFPKSLYAVEDALRIFVKDRTDAIVLDFFAGSGTTAHAVMRLNHQDGGRRQCISVTNNEVGAKEQERLRKAGLRPGDPDWERWGICDHITKPRIRAAITGRTPEGDPITGVYKFTDEFPMADGFEENAVFFTLTYEGPLSVSHHGAFERIAPLLWLRAGSSGRIIDAIPEQGWDVAEAYGVLVALDEATAFVEAMTTSETARIAYIVTDDDRRFQMVCARLPGRITPLRLYESYLTNFEIAGGRCA